MTTPPPIPADYRTLTVPEQRAYHDAWWLSLTPGDRAWRTGHATRGVSRVPLDDAVIDELEEDFA